MRETDQTVHAIQQLAEQIPEIDVIWLYGSRAKNTQQSNSDFDLAVAYNTFLDDILASRSRPEELAQDWCDTLNLNDDELSVVDINQAPVTLAYEVIRYGKVIFCRNMTRKMKEESRIESMWELDVMYWEKLHA